LASQPDSPLKCECGPSSFCIAAVGSPLKILQQIHTNIRILASLGLADGLLSGALMSKRFVYVLKSAGAPPRYYTGVTSDIGRRHAEHNAGNCSHTAKYRPWSVDVVIEFADERRAAALERYLKSGSGVAFALRHLR
jgi:predicted GIY-YIG superfamily endonuclease